MTPRQTLNLTKLAFLVLCLVAGVLMLGPFQGLETQFGLSDKEAHAIMFFTLTCGLFLVAPRRRRVELATLALTAGMAIELIQGATGRSMSISDFAADAIGVGVATLPGMVERLRHHVRTHPNLSWKDISQLDRRRPARRRVAAASRPAMAKVAA